MLRSAMTCVFSLFLTASTTLPAASQLEYGGDMPTKQQLRDAKPGFVWLEPTKRPLKTFPNLVKQFAIDLRQRAPFVYESAARTSRGIVRTLLVSSRETCGAQDCILVVTLANTAGGSARVVFSDYACASPQFFYVSQDGRTLVTCDVSHALD